MSKMPNSNPEKHESEEERGESEIDRLCDEVKKAIENAPPEKEFMERQKLITKIARKVIGKEKISKEEKKNIENRSGEVEFPNFQTLMDVLREFGFDEDFIKERGAEIIEHENAHLKTAETEGLKTKILLRFFKEKDGSVQATPSIFIKFKEDKERISDSLKKVIEAPNNLSPSDKEKIE